MGEDRRRAWVHLGSEFLVVFLSVVLALVANDWRQSQIDHRSERQSLTLMLRELRRDSLEPTFYRRMLLEQDSAAAWLVTHIDRSDVPSDSVRRTAVKAMHYFNYRPTFPTYDGLRTSGRLTLIREPDLHDAVVSFSAVTVPYLDDLRQNVKSWSLAAVRADHEYLGDVASLGKSAAWLAQRIDRVFLPASGKLQALIRQDLGVDGR